MAATSFSLSRLPGLGLWGVKRPASMDPTSTYGQMGTQVTGGFIVSNEKSAELSGVAKYRNFSDILVNSSIAAASVRYFLNLIGRSSWKFAPSEADEDGKYAELVQRAIEEMDTPWHRVVRRMAMYRFYGFSVQEWTARREKDGTIGLADVEQRPQSTVVRWDVSATGRVFGVVQQPPNAYGSGELYLPREKLVYAVDDSLTDSPEGLGLLRACSEPFRRLRRYEQLEGYAFEADLRGIPVGRAPLEQLERLVRDGTISGNDRDRVLAPIKSFLTTHIKTPNLGMLMDSSTYRNQGEDASVSGVKKWDIGLMQASASMAPEVAKTIDRLNREIARIIGTEGLMLGGDGKGSLALSEDKSNSFFLTVDGTLTECRAVVKKDLVQTVMRLNGWPEEMTPEPKTDDVKFKDVQAMAAALKDMALAGAVLPPDDPAIDVMREELGLPRSDPDAMALAAENASLLGPDNRPGSKRPGTDDRSKTRRQ